MALLSEISFAGYSNKFSYLYIFDAVVHQNDMINSSNKFSNSLEPPGLSPHKLELKVGAQIILT